MVTALEAAVDDVQALDLECVGDEQVLDLFRRLERCSRRLAAVDHAAIAQVEARGLPFHHGCATTAVFLRHLLNLHPGEASARVRAARALGPRRALSGEALDPVYPATAMAVADGQISARHAEVIVRTIERLPDAIAAVHDRHVEQTLVTHARTLDPRQLAHAGERMLACLDHDGTLADYSYRERTRGLSGARRADGSGIYRIEATAELAELLDVTVAALGGPAPAADGTPDPRTPGQRRHDALSEALRRTLGAGRLPDVGGMRSTVVLTMDVTDFAAGTGMATSGHGYPVPVEVAKNWLEPEARAILVLLSHTHGIEAYSSVQRLFTEQQRLAMLARDRGCSYPGCDAAGAWCQAHHVTEHRRTRRTGVDDGTLACRPHHRSFEAMGWTSVMIAGQPHWIPPTWIDPAQAPRRNTMHDRPGLDPPDDP